MVGTGILRFLEILIFRKNIIRFKFLGNFKIMRFLKSAVSFLAVNFESIGGILAVAWWCHYRERYKGNAGYPTVETDWNLKTHCVLGHPKK